MFSKNRAIHRSTKLFIAAGITCLLFAAVMVSRHYSHSHEKANDRELLTKNSISFASLEGLSLEEKINNEMSFSINAGKAHVRNRKAGFFRVAVQKVVEMENVTVRSRENENGTDLIEIRSDRATMFLGSKDILFKGNVTCSSEDGATLNTGQLMWDKKRNTFKTDNEYAYTSNDGVHHKGKGFESDSAFKVINFKNIYKRLPRGEISDHG